MSFLDFLKKKQDAPVAMDAPPPPPDLPEELFHPNTLTPPISPEEEIKAMQEAHPGEWQVESTPMSHEEFAPPVAPETPIEKIEIPDFSDDELTEFDHEEPTPEPMPEPVSLPEPEPVPEPAPELPDDAPMKPLEGHPAFAGMVPAKFLSSSTYFEIADAIRTSRKLIRSADDALLDAMSKHEQADDAVKDFAVEVNDIQERLMELDSALFQG